MLLNKEAGALLSTNVCG